MLLGEVEVLLQGILSESMQGRSLSMFPHVDYSFDLPSLSCFQSMVSLGSARTREHHQGPEDPERQVQLGRFHALAGWAVCLSRMTGGGTAASESFRNGESGEVTALKYVANRRFD